MTPPPEPADQDPIFACPGEMARRYAALDWSSTPLGPASSWSESLRTATALVLRSSFPMVLSWGAHHVMIYNDAYLPILGAKHPATIGGLLSEAFAEIWDEVQPMLASVLETGVPVYAEDLSFAVEGATGLEETFYTFSYSHVPEPTGAGGILVVVARTTAAVVDARRLTLLNQLTHRVLSSNLDRAEAIRASMQVLATAEHDLTHGAILAIDDSGTPYEVESFGEAPPGWTSSPGARSVVAEASVAQRFTVHRSGEHTAELVAVPLRGRQDVPVVLLLAPHPLRPLDPRHTRFLELVAEQIGQVLQLADARAVERQQLTAAAELIEAKSQFLSSISHEFRTPLTLLLGPLESVLAGRSEGVGFEDARAMHRSAMRLLRMVNALLDIATMESGTHVPQWEVVDVAGLTGELLEPFAPAVDRVGLSLRVDLERGRGAMDCDPGLWETIVLNLVANALKYTQHGSIDVRLEVVGADQVLTVADTGVGIPVEDLPHVFDRFHRAPAQGERVIDGTGIGLALVRNAAETLGGTVSVVSQVGQGSTFTVRVPVRQPSSGEGPTTSTEHGTAMAGAWADDLAPPPEEPGSASAPGRTPAVDPRGSLAPGAGEPPIVLVADDNPTMRRMLAKVLSDVGQVVTVRDGVEALEVLRERSVDLVVSDVMMPRLDGIGLLSTVRADPALRTTPIILVSARAGQASALDALEARADDYIVKPFTEDELVARCRATLELTRLRAETTAATRSRAAMLAGVSHDMQTPLAVIVSTLSLLAEEPGRSPEQRSMATRAVLRGEQLGRLVHTFLDWSRITNDVDLDPRVRSEELQGLVRRVAADYHRVRVVSSDEPLDVLVDADRTSNILHNLLANAVRAAHQDIAIAIHVRGDTVDVEVADDGAGVDPALLPRLFESFASSSERGTGLGLHISRLAARAQGGDLTLHSTGPSGTVFVLTVPRA